MYNDVMINDINDIKDTSKMNTENSCTYSSEIKMDESFEIFSFL